MIGIATTDMAQFGYGDLDEPYLLAALARAGVKAELLHWDDPGVDWAACDLVLLRSTWNYPQHLDAFTQWLDALPVPVLNPPAVVRWNADKRYLSALAGAGVAVVATGYATDPGTWAAALAAIDTPQLVVKPTVSAGSDLTGRFDAADPAAAQLAERIWAAGKVAMVQPFVESVATAGELALMYFGGSFSHAVRKGPILDSGGGLLGGTYTETMSPAEADPAWLAAAERVLRTVSHLLPGGEPVYARVDLVAGAQGEPVLLELELIEPSLFFFPLGGDPDAGVGAEAADRLVRAVLAR